MNQSFYLLRHGLTSAVKYENHYGKNNKDAHILPEAFKSTQKIGQYLQSVPSDFFVSSGYIRCRETAEIVSEIIGKKFVIDERINDYNELPDLPAEAKLEPFSFFQKRIEDFYRDVGEKNYQNIVICTHAAVIAAFKDLVTTGKIMEEHLFNYPMPGVLTVIKNQKIEEIDFNTLNS